MGSCAVSGAVCGGSNRVGCSCRACGAFRRAVMLGGVAACPLAVEGAALVAMAVETADEVASVLVAERDGYVLG